MRKLIIFTFCLAVLLSAEGFCSERLSGKLIVGVKGGPCYTLGEGYTSGEGVDGRYGVGISAEYFVLEPLSLGMTLVYNSFDGEWRRSYYYVGWNTRYYTEWNWTNVSLFGKFVWAPREEVSPYFTAGVGAYIPRTKDKWYDHPDTIHTYTSRGERHFGVHFGVGVHYFLNRKVMVFLEFPAIFIRAKDFNVYEYESSPRIYHDCQILNLFAGINFLFGSGKKETKDDF